MAKAAETVKAKATEIEENKKAAAVFSAAKDAELVKKQNARIEETKRIDEIFAKAEEDTSADFFVFSNQLVDQIGRTIVKTVYLNVKDISSFEYQTAKHGYDEQYSELTMVMRNGDRHVFEARWSTELFKKALTIFCRWKHQF